MQKSSDIKGFKKGNGVNSAKGFGDARGLGNVKGFTLLEVMVALSLLGLSVAGAAQLHHLAYQHISLTREIQEATYLADSHLNTLSADSRLSQFYQTGEYARGLGVQAYRWELNMRPLNADVLQPESTSLSDKVIPVAADLRVWVDQGARELRFHSLLLLKPVESQNSSRPEFKIGSKR